MTDSFSIDIGEKRIRVIELSDNGKQIELKALGSAEANPHYYSTDTEKNIETQAGIINQLLATAKIKNKNAQVIIPDMYSFSQVLTLPKLNEKELQSAIRYQADQFIPLPIDEVSIDIEIISENPKSKELTVFIVASPIKIVKQIEKTIELAGLQPNGLENELSVIRRFIFNRGKLVFPNQSSFLLINFGFLNSTIYFFDRQGLVVLSRNIKTGLELLIKDLKANLNIDDTKAYQILQTIGFEKNSSIDTEIYLGPIIKELSNEINHFLIIAKEQHNIDVKQIYTFNYDNMVLSLDKAIQKNTSVSVNTFPVIACLKPNAVSQAYGAILSEFFSGITGAIL